MEGGSDLEKILDKGSHELVVENFREVSSVKNVLMNMINREEFIVKSEEFAVGGHSWAIWFYPNGREKNGRQYAPLYLGLIKSESKRPVQLLFELLLLDQSGKGKHQGAIGRKEVYSFTVNSMYGLNKCIDRGLLRSAGSDYVRNDCVRIRATLAVYNFVPEDLRRLLESKQWADVIIKVGDDETSFSAHKLILAARCPALLSLQTQSSHDDSIILVPHIQPRIFKAVLSFIYTETLCEDEHEVDHFWFKIFAAAELLELKTLKGICESHIPAEVLSAFMESNRCEYLKENNSLDNHSINDPSISIKGVFNMYNKVLSLVKKPAVSIPWFEDATYKHSKIKEL